jgi:DNA polymerase III alpha subunit
MFNIDNIPLNDIEVYKNIYHKGNCFGIFQCDSSIGIRTCKRFQPSNILEISLVISIVRPGVLRFYVGDKSMTDIIIERKHGIEKIEYLHPALEPILKSTYGVIVYQEQAIQIAQQIAGFTPLEADNLRRAIGKKLSHLMSQIENQFIEGCIKTNVVNLEIAKQLFDNIKASQRYSFNLSHGVSYSINSYKTAYCKHYYPLDFFTGCLKTANTHQKPLEYVKQCVLDSRNNNIDIVVPDIRDKQIDPYIKNNKYVSFGLSNIKGIGEAAIRGLFLTLETIEKSLDQFKWVDFLFLLSGKISSDVLEGLIYSGALDYFKKTRSAMFFELEKWHMLTKGEKAWIIKHHSTSPFNSLLDAVACVAATKKNGGGCHTQKKADFCLGLAESIKNPTININDSPYFISMMEEKYLGCGISCVKHDGTSLNELANYTCEQINKGCGSTNISLAIEIVRFKEHKIKKGNSSGKYMAFLDVFDKSGLLSESVVVFAEKWEEIRDQFDEKGAYFIVCNRSKKNSLIVENIQKIC